MTNQTSSLPSSMQDTICLVTGATAGIGEVTALELARLGATVVLVGRNAQKAAAIVEQIKQQTGNPQVEFMLADLSLQKDVRRLAAQFQQKYDRLHVLVNNAGAIYISRQVTAEGFEMTWALNHLAYFLLTNLLLDVMKASAPARIINVASDVHTTGKITFDDLQGEKKFGGFGSYKQSKLANVLFTYELARRLEGTGVTVNALHPGVVASSFGTNNGWIGRNVVRKAMNLFSISNEEGARPTLYLATSPAVEGVTGQYFDKEKAVASSKASYDTATAARLWQVSEGMTG
ncbi:MAG: SDR family oxidoreductase [Chloroflexota bacterium]|nr:SDR family oxidoreductase [Chloroflexota bacterium]